MIHFNYSAAASATSTNSSTSAADFTISVIAVLEGRANAMTEIVKSAAEVEEFVEVAEAAAE
ncbi:MAG: hypothetical protein ACT4OH_03375 [Methylophilaceae bacterium]